MVISDILSINISDNGIYAITMIIKILQSMVEILKILGAILKLLLGINKTTIQFLCLCSSLGMMFVQNHSIA